MDEVFVYNCPSCGGKVEYINNKWHCNYCGNSYDALFAKKNKTLPKFENKKYIMYQYKCSKCNNTFVSLDEKNAKCTFCKEESNSLGKRFIASSIIDTDILIDEANSMYIDEISKFIKNIDGNYFNINLVGGYIYCDLYNGCVVLQHNKITEKFIFVNLLVPNIKDDNYKFMYELGNIGISRSYEISKFNNVTDEIIRNGNYIYDVDNIDYENDIVNSCIDIFSKKYNINDKNNIKIDKYLSVNEGTFIPCYTNKVIVNDKEYNQYILGNKAICKKDKTILLKRVKSTNVILDFPDEQNASIKYKRYKFFTKILKSLVYSLLPLTIVSLFTLLRSGYDNTIMDNSYSYIMVIIFIIVILLFILSFTFLLLFRKKMEYYHNSMKITKSNYFNQIINNSNYVKVIKVKR